MKKIPFAANLWRENLTEICENIIAKVNPDRFYTFGSQDYTNFVKKTHFWKSLSEERIGIKIFESTGSAGPYWISKILGELVEYTEKNNLDLFAFEPESPRRLDSQIHVLLDRSCSNLSFQEFFQSLYRF